MKISKYTWVVEWGERGMHMVVLSQQYKQTQDVLKKVRNASHVLGKVKISQKNNLEQIRKESRYENVNKDIKLCFVQ